jgi:hypothetical protein
MTVLDKHPELKEPMRRIELKPPKQPPKEPRRPVRWIAWTFSIIVLAAAAIAALIITNGSGGESFDEIYEAGSPLAYGAVHEPGFEIAPRWVGESGPTLEEIEMLQGYESSVGEADQVLGEYMIEPGFTPDELAGLQASVGEADLKYLDMASTG